MQKKQRILKFCVIASALVISSSIFMSCASRRAVESEAADQPATLFAEKLDQMNTTISRLQTRIEELDAKQAALNDKVEASKIAAETPSVSKSTHTELPKQIVKTPHANVTVKAEESPADIPKVSHDTEEALGEYTRAMAMFKSAKFSAAETAFNRFAENHPEHILAGSAQFYAGESYYKLGQHKLALGEYSKVVSSFKSSPRLASALARMIRCHQAIGNKDEAEKTLLAAQSLFSGSPTLDEIEETKSEHKLDQKGEQKTANGAEHKTEVDEPKRELAKESKKEISNHNIEVAPSERQHPTSVSTLKASPMEPSSVLHDDKTIDEKLDEKEAE